MAEDLEDDLRVADAGLMLCGSKNVFPKSRRHQVKTTSCIRGKDGTESGPPGAPCLLLGPFPSLGTT
jgi:hypothetical protein